MSYYFNLATLSSEVIYFFEGFIDVNVWQCNQTSRRLCVNLFPTIEREKITIKIDSTKKLKICQLLNVSVWKRSLCRIGRRSYERP